VGKLGVNDLGLANAALPAGRVTERMDYAELAIRTPLERIRVEREVEPFAAEYGRDVEVDASREDNYGVSLFLEQTKQFVGSRTQRDLIYDPLGHFVDLVRGKEGRLALPGLTQGDLARVKLLVDLVGHARAILRELLDEDDGDVRSDERAVKIKEYAEEGKSRGR
jgi:hypothetical protein